VHSMRATAATNAPSNNAGIAKVREWFGHADVSTTRLYDRRDSKQEEARHFTQSIEDSDAQQTTAL
jgi:integrase/recombinase XerD